ncbi:hypothetical protein DAI22_07g008100 [Oryza sativa Japonica Group]|nr:hypothetical protein DAI22_07g008100 [Oryza sativa Japonica Group]
MSPPLLLRRALQRLLPHRTRSFCSSRLSSSSSSPGEVMNDNQVKSIRRFDEFEAMAQREIVEDVEEVRKLKSEDRNYLNRLLTSWGVPNGEFRDKLMWGGNVAAIFIASSAVGTLSAKIDGSA